MAAMARTKAVLALLRILRILRIRTIFAQQGRWDELWLLLRYVLPHPQLVKSTRSHDSVKDELVVYRCIINQAY